jgi:Na+-transporting methylmalonyl-CoA/oxaloacetate decarboxylase gamma subunit
MTFEEKSTLTMTLLLLAVFGGYFALVLGPVAASPSRQDAASGLVIGATVVLAILAILATVSHIVLALINRKQASARQDERGRLIALRSERLSGYILAVGMFAWNRPRDAPDGDVLDRTSTPRRVGARRGE